MKKTVFFGLLVIILAFSFTICDSGNNKNDDNGENETKIVIKDIQLYEYVDELLFNIYLGNGNEQTVIGKLVLEPRGDTIFSFGEIGKISIDGKLTLTLPNNVPESNLATMDGVKYGLLALDPFIYFITEDGHGLESIPFYSTGNITIEGISLKKGWNVINNSKWIFSE
jgi:hypothetical protein